jgi:adenylosuccinate synthase
MNQRAYIVIGLGFGDEGKGLVTDFISSRNVNPIVIRFNGGQQAGHTVVTNEKRHVFSNFGSGTLRNISTYWSKYCTFAPEFFFEELAILNLQIPFYIDPLCPITTHYDVLYNRIKSYTIGNAIYGSCGLGFGATVTRHERGPILYAKDLTNFKVLKLKLKEIRNYYGKLLDEFSLDFGIFAHEEQDELFISIAENFFALKSIGLFQIVNEEEIFNRFGYQTFVFEGSQGVLLDSIHGTKPFVTKSSTTSKNALEILARNRKHSNIIPEVFYVTRCYSTRHGTGPFIEHEPLLQLKNTQDETNVYNEFQGVFKTSYLNRELLNHSIECDSLYSQVITKNLVVTCVDQLIDEGFTVFEPKGLQKFAITDFPNLINASLKSIRYSYNSCSDYLDDHTQWF